MNIDQRLATLCNLQDAIHQWSHTNFGEQNSKAAVIDFQPISGGESFTIPLPLGSLAPLLGMVEEVGEYTDATVPSEILDALADIGIYLLDYCWREDANIVDAYKRALVLRARENDNPRVIGTMAVVGGVGSLCHATLKRHQGIRGFDNPAIYQESRQAAIARILFGLEVLAQELASKSIIDLIGNTFLKIVKKRNWKANPESAGLTQEQFDNAASN